MAKRFKSISTVAIVAVIIIIIVIAGVGGYYYYMSTTKVTHPPSSKGSVKIALLLPGVETDLSWNEAGYASTQQLAKDLTNAGYNVTVSVAEGLYTPEEIQPAMQTYASKGYNIIIGMGYQDQAPATSIYTQYPNTLFLIADGYQSGPNMQIVIDDAAQLGFVQGVQAALLSKNHVVAAIGGENVGDITWATKGFDLGVQYADQNFLHGTNTTIITTFVGDFNNPAGALSAATAAVSDGADVLWCSGDGITEGVAEEAATANVPFLYAEYNATAFDPETTYGGVSFTFAPLLYQAVASWLVNKTVSPLPYYATFGNGGLTLQLTHYNPSNVTTIVNNIESALASNKIMIYQEAPNGTLIYSPVTPSYNSLFG
ncbi:MAG: BMP family ABC transporter substrate-binding protein [Conexivisphaerales archaeon]